MNDTLNVLRELLEALDALEVERRDLWSVNRTQRLNDARTRASKANAAARRRAPANTSTDSLHETGDYGR